MKTKLGNSPSRKRRLKPWVRNFIELLKALQKCTVRLAICVIGLMLFIQVFDIPKAQYDTEIYQKPAIVEVMEEPLPSVQESDKLAVIEEPQETHEEKIDRLVQEVESGKAGNGDARKEYLGEYYDEVQSIIDKRYANNNSKKSSNKTVVKATAGSKKEYQDYAYELCIANGWSETDFLALVKLWERESNWNPNAHNKSSGAHGIPQSLPASKMASEGDDYMTNYKTQIKWGIKYIKNRYGNPSQALAHSDNKGWY